MPNIIIYESPPDGGPLRPVVESPRNNDPPPKVSRPDTPTTSSEPYDRRFQEKIIQIVGIIFLCIIVWFIIWIIIDATRSSDKDINSNEPSDLDCTFDDCT